MCGWTAKALELVQSAPAGADGPRAQIFKRSSRISYCFVLLLTLLPPRYRSASGMIPEPGTDIDKKILAMTSLNVAAADKKW